MKRWQDMTEAEFDKYVQGRKRNIKIVRVVLAIAAISLIITGISQHSYTYTVLGVAAGIGFAFFKFSAEYED